MPWKVNEAIMAPQVQPSTAHGLCCLDSQGSLPQYSETWPDLSMLPIMTRCDVHQVP